MKLSVFVCSAVGVATGLHAEPALLHGLLLATPAAAAWLPQATHADRRAFLSGAIAAASGLAPLPAFARSKEKAAQMALQKSTAKEAREAMKEYKYAPRPELVGSAETGYSFKAGTVKAGSQGELASYFTDKGASIQADYKKQMALAKGLSAAEAAKEAEKARQAVLATKNTKKTALSADEIRIMEKAKEFGDKTDDMGRRIF